MVWKCSTIMAGFVTITLAHISTEDKIKFCLDFVMAFDIKTSLFLATDEFDIGASDITLKSVSAFIKYNTEYEEREVAHHIKKLTSLGNIASLIFLDKGHGELLQILVNELKLLKNGLTVLIPESDISPDVNLYLHLDTSLYIYSASGSIIMLKEMYSVNGKIIVNKIGIFKDDKRLIIFEQNIWDRRTSMEGLKIKVATLNYKVLHELYYDKSNAVVGGGGFFIEPLNILAQRLNFSLEFMPSIDGQFGINVNGTWNGLIGMLVRGQADIAAAGLSSTIERANVTTFGKAFELEEFTLLSPHSTKKKADFNKYHYMFPNSVWCLICAMIFTFASIFATMNYCGLNYMHDASDSEEFTLINGICLILTFFRQIYYNVQLEANSSKILFIISAMSTYLIYVHYTAYLVATSTTGIVESPIRSFKDVMRGRYQVFVVNNTADHGVLRSARPGTPMHEVYHYTMVDNPDAFLKSYKVMSNVEHAENALYFGSEYYIIILNHELTVLDIQVISILSVLTPCLK